MSDDVTELLETAIREELIFGGEGGRYREDARTKMRKFFGVCLGEELTEDDMDDLFDTIRVTGLSIQDFAVKAIRDAIKATLAGREGGSE